MRAKDHRDKCLGHSQKHNPDCLAARRCVINGCGCGPADRAHYRYANSYPVETRWHPDRWRYLCRYHHIEEGTIGEVEFAHKYDMLDELIQAEYPLWRINEYRKKNKLPEIKE